MRRELGFESDLPYEILGGGVDALELRPTSRTATSTRPSRCAGDVAKNPHLKVFVAYGYYDLATPYFATEYTLSPHGPRPRPQRARITIGYYEAGHMMYIHEPSLPKLKADLAEFIRTPRESNREE